MQKEIHPKYNPNVKVKCSCGADFEVGSTVDQIKVEICSNCHPLYTGNKRMVDTAGRVDRFQARLKKSEDMKKQADERTKKANERETGVEPKKAEARSSKTKPEPVKEELKKESKEN